MANITNFSSPEQANGAGDVYANNLTIFGGEVLSDFKDRNIMSHLIGHTTIVNSRTKTFDRVGRATSAYHTRGVEVLGQSIDANKIDISVDRRPIIADVFLDEVEDILSHYESRSKYVDELSRSISEKIDARILQVLVNASKAPATITGGLTGGSAIAANADTDGAVLIAELFKARDALAINNVPLDSLYCVVSSTVFHMLAQENDVTNQDINSMVNGGTDIVKEVIRVAGINVVMTNHMPSGVVAADPLDGNVYAGTYTNLVGVVFDKSAAMTVEAKALTIGSDGYTEKLQGTVILAKTLQGTGIFRNEAAYSIFSA